MNKTKMNKILEWMRHYNKETNCKGVVLGLSGGKDSTVVAMLSKLVYGDNVLAILMPNGEQKDISDSIDIAEKLKLNYKIVNIETIYNSLINVVENKLVETPTGKDFVENCCKITDKSKTNIPPRIRMTILYAVAQSYGYRVIGTGNLSEQYLNWFTKFGDGACDFNPIAELTCTEVKELGKLLTKEFNLGNDFVKAYIDKIPADGLTGKSDEENFGFSYKLVDQFIESGLGDFTLDELEKYETQLEKINQLHEAGKHKHRMPYTTKDWIFGDH